MSTENAGTGSMGGPPPTRGDLLAHADLIAHVLCRAHRMAAELNAPNEARAILHVARSFADEMAAVNPQFDRLRFIEAATDGEPSAAADGGAVD